ncbi:MAG: hypothetical protein GY746_01405, partial [Gammaproteobacteria bacterium]|nr:hypothetical protein [Gammaproteobacteria bacterium]
IAGEYHFPSVDGTNGQILQTNGSGTLSWIPVPGTVTSVAGRTGDVLLDKTDVGLPDIDHTSDLSKPISIATQSALDGKQATITGAATTITLIDLAPNRAVISDHSGKVRASTVTDTELGYVSGVTSSIQTQLDNYVSSQWTTTASDIKYNTGNVGIGIGSLTPSTNLDVGGKIRMRSGAGSGYVAISDGNGVMTWTDPASITTDTANIIADADNDTKIQVEEGTDDDIIRFDMAGTEFFRMDSGRLEVVNTGHSVFIGEGAGANDDFFHAAPPSINNGYRPQPPSGSNSNVGIGYQALFTNTTGYGNVANGALALFSNETGYHNVANGTNALFYNTSGKSNVANGSYALNANTTGSWNTANGRRALDGNTTGSYNTAIGYFANVKYDNLTNATAIGAHATVSQDNSMVLGSIDGENGASADTKVGIGTSAPTNKLDVNGSIRMRNGAFSGYVPVSDINGVMTWTDPAIYTAGDDLGDHTATLALNLSGNNITNGGTINASSFVG